MPIALKAVFYPTQTKESGYLGSASLIVADAIVIRGIAVFDPDPASSNVMVAFPTYGHPQRTYIQPENRTAYDQIAAVITEAVKDLDFSRAEQAGTTELSLSVTDQPASAPEVSGSFSLHIEGFCILHGIEATESDWPLPDGSKIAVTIPSLSSSQVPHQDLTVFEGLVSAREHADGSMEYTDYQQLINQLVRAKYQQILRTQHQQSQYTPSGTPASTVAEAKNVQPETALSSDIVR